MRVARSNTSSTDRSGKFGSYTANRTASASSRAPTNSTMWLMLSCGNRPRCNSGTRPAATARANSSARRACPARENGHSNRQLPR